MRFVQRQVSNMNKPIFTMLVGLPGSSKSTWAENNKETLNMIIHSSDEIRAELLDESLSVISDSSPENQKQF
jgi:predicted kinase